MKTQEFFVEKGQAGQRLDKWLIAKFPFLNNSLLQKLLRKGDIKLDGKKVDHNIRLEQGQQIIIKNFVFNYNNSQPEVKNNSAQKPKFSKEDEKLLKDSIIYKDDNIIILNKPTGLAVQGGSKVGKNIDDMLSILQFDKEEPPRLTHRLDKDTSGVLILARTKEAATVITEKFKKHQIQKIYLAILAGVPKAKKGKIEVKLGKLKEGAKDKVKVHDDGDNSVTYYKILDFNKLSSIVEFTPLTGRTHQLRVHSLELGTPILGDGKYGGKAAFIDGLSAKLHLHAKRIIIDDLYGKKLDIAADIPLHIKESLSLLGFKNY